MSFMAGQPNQWRGGQYTQRNAQGTTSENKDTNLKKSSEIFSLKDRGSLSWEGDSLLNRSENGFVYPDPVAICACTFDGNAPFAHSSHGMEQPPNTLWTDRLPKSWDGPNPDLGGYAKTVGNQEYNGNLTPKYHFLPVQSTPPPSAYVSSDAGTNQEMSNSFDMDSEEEQWLLDYIELQKPTPAIETHGRFAASPSPGQQMSPCWYPHTPTESYSSVRKYPAVVTPEQLGEGSLKMPAFLPGQVLDSMRKILEDDGSQDVTAPREQARDNPAPYQRRTRMLEIAAEDRVYCSINERKCILHGRCLSKTNPSNKLFRAIISSNREYYQKWLDDDDKHQYTLCLLANFKAHGFQFLKKDNDNGGWYIVSDEEARRKISQALRENWKN